MAEWEYYKYLKPLSSARHMATKTRRRSPLIYARTTHLDENLQLPLCERPKFIFHEEHSRAALMNYAQPVTHTHMRKSSTERRTPSFCLQILHGGALIVWPSDYTHMRI
jgi:hypothetical protein